MTYGITVLGLWRDCSPDAASQRPDRSGEGGPLIPRQIRLSAHDKQPVTDVQLPKLDVAGSIPVSRSFLFSQLQLLLIRRFAKVGC